MTAISRRRPLALLRVGPDRELEPVGIGQGEVARAPGLVARLLVELAAARLDPLRESVDVLSRRAVQPKALSLLPVAALLPVVLSNHESDAAGLERDPGQLSVLLPALLDDEPEDVPVPGETLLQIVYGEAGRCLAHLQRVRFLANLRGHGLRFLRGDASRKSFRRSLFLCHLLPPALVR